MIRSAEFGDEIGICLILEPAIRACETYGIDRDFTI